MIFLIENSEEDLRRNAEALTELLPDAELKTFTSSLEALAEARKCEVSIAVLDDNMPGLDGLDLGQYMKDLNPLINLIYLAEDNGRCFDAMTLHASGYLLKPATTQNLRHELEDLRHPAEQVNHKRVFAQTFGNFELFVDGKPVAFKYSRTKEIVALLVNNRGAQTTNGEIIANLWEDDGDPDKKVSYLCNLRQDLQNTLTKLGVNRIINKQRGSMGIAADKIECDLYDWLAKKKESRYNYLGDYMNQYSWSEYMHAELDDISYALEDEDN